MAIIYMNGIWNEIWIDKKYELIKNEYGVFFLRDNSKGISKLETVLMQQLILYSLRGLAFIFYIGTVILQCVRCTVTVPAVNWLLIICKAVPLQAWSGPEGSRKLTFWRRNYYFFFNFSTPCI